MIAQLPLVKDQLLSHGANHFVVFSASGEVLESTGDFDNKLKQQLAFTILQQCAEVCPNEPLKRITMTFDDVVYVATTVVDAQGTFGVVVKRPVGAVLTTD